MSSRTDHRRRERSWEREDRDRDRDRNRDRDKDRYPRSARSGYREPGRRRNSRSRSPRRDKREHDRDRDYKGSRRDDRRDHDRDRDDRRREDRKNERKPERKDERRDHHTPERTTPREKDVHSNDISRYSEPTRPHEPHPDAQLAARTESPEDEVPVPTSSKPNLDPDTPAEEGEEMDVTTAADDSMMAMMGLTGFGSTKGKQVDGNQEGGANIKKTRTWRQYMNRRGGFNRPLDKIK